MAPEESNSNEKSEGEEWPNFDPEAVKRFKTVNVTIARTVFQRAIPEDLCRAYVFGKKPGGQRIHLCGRQALHNGLHRCYCGHEWKRSKGSKLCHCWKETAVSKLSTAEPGKSVSEERILDLYGKRKFNLSE